jgi:hypothetical protein
MCRLTAILVALLTLGLGSGLEAAAERSDRNAKIAEAGKAPLAAPIPGANEPIAGLDDTADSGTVPAPVATSAAPPRRLAAVRVSHRMVPADRTILKEARAPPGQLG